MLIFSFKVCGLVYLLLLFLSQQCRKSRITRIVIFTKSVNWVVSLLSLSVPNYPVTTDNTQFTTETHRFYGSVVVFSTNCREQSGQTEVINSIDQKFRIKGAQDNFHVAAKWWNDEECTLLISLSGTFLTSRERGKSCIHTTPRFHLIYRNSKWNGTFMCQSYLIWAGNLTGRDCCNRWFIILRQQWRQKRL